MKIKPLFNYILIKPVKEETRGEFVVSQMDNMGEVMAVGRSKGAKVKVGQKVIYSRTASHENVLFDNESFLLIAQADVMATVE